MPCSAASGATDELTTIGSNELAELRESKQKLEQLTSDKETAHQTAFTNLQSERANELEAGLKLRAELVAKHTAQVETMMDEVEREKVSKAETVAELEAAQSAAAQAHEDATREHEVAVSTIAAREAKLQDELESTRSSMVKELEEAAEHAAGQDKRLAALNNELAASTEDSERHKQNLNAELQLTKNQLELVGQRASIATVSTAAEIADLRNSLSRVSEAHTKELERSRSTATQGTREAVAVAQQEMELQHAAVLAERDARIGHLEKLLPTAIAVADQNKAEMRQQLALTPQRPSAPPASPFSAKRLAMRKRSRTPSLLSKRGTSSSQETGESLQRIKEIEENDAQTLQAFQLQQQIAKELQSEVARAQQAEAKAREELERRLAEQEKQHRVEVEAVQKRFEKTDVGQVDQPDIASIKTAVAAADAKAVDKIEALKKAHTDTVAQLNSQLAQERRVGESLRDETKQLTVRHAAKLQDMVDVMGLEQENTVAALEEVHGKVMQAHELTIQEQQTAMAQQVAREATLQAELERTRSSLVTELQDALATADGNAARLAAMDSELVSSTAHAQQSERQLGMELQRAREQLRLAGQQAASVDAAQAAQIAELQVSMFVTVHCLRGMCSMWNYSNTLKRP
eukprot:COSAG05_NODE_1155_length_5690_cov_39.512788_3_plen_635_part_00